MTTDDTRCPSCGILYVTHPGLIPTCRELMEARAEMEQMRQTVAVRWDKKQAEYDAAMDRAEAAEAERDRYREENERLAYSVIDRCECGVSRIAKDGRPRPTCWVTPTKYKEEFRP